MAAMLASSLCALLDSLLLARQSAQLAAVSVSFPLLMLIQTLGFTLGMGAGSAVSRALGGDDKPAAYAAASTALYAALALCLPLCALGFFFAAPLAQLLGAASAAVGEAAAYARYVLASGAPLCLSLVLSSLLRAQGQALSSMLAFVLGAAVSLPMQLLLIGRLGVHGAGIAMLAREGVTLTCLAVSTLRLRHIVRPRLRAVSCTLRVWREIMRSGAPTLLRQGLCSVSSALLTRAGGALGEHALAGMGLCVRVLALVSSAVIGFGQGFAPVCGYACGAGRMDRAAQAYRLSMRCVVAALSLLGAAGFFFAAPLLRLLCPQEEVLSFAARALRAQCLALPAMGAVILMTMLTQALGMPVRAALVAASRQGYVFIPLVLTLPMLFGETGLILCQSISDALSLILCLLLTRGVFKERHI